LLAPWVPYCRLPKTSGFMRILSQQQKILFVGGTAPAGRRVGCNQMKNEQPTTDNGQPRTDNEKLKESQHGSSIIRYSIYYTCKPRRQKRLLRKQEPMALYYREVLRLDILRALCVSVVNGPFSAYSPVERADPNSLLCEGLNVAPHGAHECRSCILTSPRFCWRTSPRERSAGSEMH